MPHTSGFPEGLSRGGMASTARLVNVKDDVKAAVGSDSVATGVAAALVDLFEITSHKRFRAFGTNYTKMYASPTKTIKGSLVIDREVLVLIAPFTALQARTIVV